MSEPGSRAGEGPDPVAPGAAGRREAPASAGSREGRLEAGSSRVERLDAERLDAGRSGAEHRGVEEVVVPVLAERLSIGKRRLEERVRVATRTREREQVVDEELLRERVEVERVPVGRVVEAVPAVREEGDTTVLPVVVEEVVVQRRLVLKEEIRIRRLRGTERHRETVVLREQDAVITRDPAGEAAGDSPASPDETA